MRTVVFEAQRAVGLGHEDGRRQKRLKNLLHRHRARAGTAAAVRRGKRLMQVQVHHVHAEIAGTDFAHQRVHVGAIHIEQAAFGVHDFGDLVDLLLEHSQRVGIGEHERSDVFVHLRGQRGHIHHAAGHSISNSRPHSRPSPQSRDSCRARNRESELSCAASPFDW